MLKVLIEFYNQTEPLIRSGIPIEKVRELGVVRSLMRLKEEAGLDPIEKARIEMRQQVDALKDEYEVASE